MHHRVRKLAGTPRSMLRRKRWASSDSHGPDIKLYRKAVYDGLLSAKGRNRLALTEEFSADRSDLGGDGVK